MSAPFIQIEALSYSYSDAGRQHRVLDSAELHVARGEVVAMLGRSGSGKSTLLNLLAGIDRPGAGRIRIDGQDVAALDERAGALFRRRHIGFVYQFFHLIPTLTVGENVALPLELNRMPRREQQSTVAAMLDAVGLQRRADAFPDQLSGGEQQRIAVARALIHQPALVLADEPTGNLDATSGARVLQLLLDISQRQHSTLLIATHSLRVAQAADRILTLENGRLQQRTSEFAW